MSKYTLAFVFFEMVTAALRPGSPSKVEAAPEPPPLVQPADRN